jgi:hypothetical protein
VAENSNRNTDSSWDDPEPGCNSRPSTEIGGRSTGDCAIRVLTDQPATAEIGFTLAPASQGRGIAAEAVTAVLKRLFEGHNIHRIYAQTDDRNLAAHRLLERLGFRCGRGSSRPTGSKSNGPPSAPTPSSTANGRTPSESRSQMIELTTRRRRPPAPHEPVQLLAVPGRIASG